MNFLKRKKEEIEIDEPWPSSGVNTIRNTKAPNRNLTQQTQKHIKIWKEKYNKKRQDRKRIEKNEAKRVYIIFKKEEENHATRGLKKSHTDTARPWLSSAVSSRRRRRKKWKDA